ncbi:MAG: hypothetical protein HY775_04525 [Acidobacteria bacterium]|nr:hypothetical protein [Acidobacteriota bacterium]
MMFSIRAIAWGNGAGRPACAVDLPTVVPVLAFAMYEVAFLAGFAAGAELSRAPAVAGWSLTFAVGGLDVLASIAARVRLAHFGGFDEFHAGRARAA